MADNKTINDHLFDQLHRLSTATEKNIDVEVKRSHAIISVSEKVLDVSRIKLQIIGAGNAAVGQFSEIDAEGFKKKLQ